MGMNHGLDVGALAVDLQVHRDLGRGPEPSSAIGRHKFSVKIDYDQVVY
jgi:hypothetical protein